MHVRCSYWDSISCLAGEVDNPSRTFPKALLWAVLLVVLSYFMPTLAALGVATETADWELGYYGKVAQQVRSRILVLFTQATSLILLSLLVFCYTAFYKTCAFG